MIQEAAPRKRLGQRERPKNVLVKMWTGARAANSSTMPPTRNSARPFTMKSP
jgi:hypothetical protein